MRQYSRVARARAQELNTSALYAAGIPSGSFRIGSVAVFFGNLPIIAWVAIDQDANQAKFLGALDLEASEDASVFGDGNLPLEIDAGVDKILVILVGSVVDVYKGASDVAAGRVAVESWDLVLGGGGGIFFKNVFDQGCLECDTPGFGVTRLLQQGDAVIDGVVDVDIVGDDAGLDAPFLPPVLGPLGLETRAFSMHCRRMKDLKCYATNRRI